MDASDTRLGVILSHLTDRHGWHHAEGLRLLETLWQRAVGAVIAEHSRILTLTNDGILIVAVPSSVWSQELGYYKPHILEAIRDELPELRIQDVRTRVRSDVERLPRVSEAYRPSPYAVTELHASDTRDLGVLLARVQEKYQKAAQEWLDDGFISCRQCHAPTLKGYRLCVVCDLAQQKKLTRS